MFTRALCATDDTIARQHLFNRVAELVESGALRTTLGEHDGRITVDNLRRVRCAGIASHPRQTGAGGILSER
ncbi:hypothetical protein QYY77_07125 [Xanthomonas campestris pv. campestris]|nr:hypothetical protein [Xanthomonas campestris]MCC5069137.1 hypothetical protein [Xanthomonas campestris]MCC5086747.1 hypothetical protein [Xanthomonas campestris]MEA0735854.1 hypothetical protein [Xanthomonas campestris pv. campestris]